MPMSPLFHSHRSARIRVRAGVLLGTCLLACTACSPPPDTPTDKPVEPEATQLRDAVQAPLDRARATQQMLDAGAARQRQALEDAGG